MSWVTVLPFGYLDLRGESMIVWVKGSVTAVHTEKRKLLERNNDNFKSSRLRDGKCQSTGTNKSNGTSGVFFSPKKAKKRKWSPALLYPNMPSILSRRAEEHRDIIISPPGPSACISVSSSSLAATETNGRVFPADHSHPLLPVPCDRSSELKRGNRSQRKRDSLAYPSGA